MSAQDIIIAQSKSLPPEQQALVTKFAVESDDSWIPEEFKQGMADIAAGRVVDLDSKNYTTIIESNI
jgi:predicted transcriptional regulator